MKQAFCLLLVVFWITLPTPSSGAMDETGKTNDIQEPNRIIKNYVIGPGDVLNISIWKDEALTRRVTVLPDGHISFPLIGQIQTAGKTLAELRTEIEQKIHFYVPDPILLISIEQVNSMLVYVIGKVNKPGRFLLNAHTDVLQILAMSGGLNPFAKKNKIKIFRRNGDQTRIFDFDYEDIADGIHLEQNIYLQRGDVVVVP
jgi:polysaccharide export outer membrane protein